MRLCGPIIVALALCVASAATSTDAASCRSKKKHDCTELPAAVNLSTVPEISREIVSAEPALQKPKTSVVEAPPITTYTGPLVGISERARVPTVGYYWSLEPDTKTQ